MWLFDFFLMVNIPSHLAKVFHVLVLPCQGFPSCDEKERQKLFLIWPQNAHPSVPCPQGIHSLALAMAGWAALMGIVQLLMDTAGRRGFRGEHPPQNTQTWVTC